MTIWFPRDTILLFGKAAASESMVLFSTPRKSTSEMLSNVTTFSIKEFKNYYGTKIMISFLI
jgi:hypothetical protein